VETAPASTGIVLSMLASAVRLPDLCRTSP
jgi:hypothetical protein